MDAAQRAAHVWLDAISAYGEDHAVPVLDQLSGWLNHVDAIQTTISVDDDALVVDARPAFGGVLVLLEALLSAWCDAEDLERADAINRLRYIVQDTFADRR